MEATCTCHGWVHMFITHRPTLNLQLHNFDLFRTCRTALLRGNWQDFNWHDASRRLSAIAELLVFYFKLELHQVWLQSLMSDDFRILRTSCFHVSKKRVRFYHVVGLYAFRVVLWPYFDVITARCYASAVLAMGLCPSVTSRCSIETAERIELVLVCELPSTRPKLC